MNGWDGRTTAIYLAASFQGPARPILGDLDSIQYNTILLIDNSKGFSETIFFSRGNQIDIAQIAIYKCFLQIKLNQMLVFGERGKLEYQGKTSHSRVENQQTQSSKRRDFSALIEALESRCGSKHQTEMYRAQLRCRMRKREEILPELAQAVQRLTRQAYANAPTSLQDNLARDHFIDALPESEVQWCIHQVRPRSLCDALTTALEIEAFYLLASPPTQGS